MRAKVQNAAVYVIGRRCWSRCALCSEPASVQSTLSLGQRWNRLRGQAGQMIARRRPVQR